MASTLKDLAANFQKLDRFEGVGFRRWQKKMHFLPTSLNVVYVLSTLRPVEREEETLEQARRRIKALAKGPKSDESWWIDTGATRHMCKDMHHFKSFKELKEGPTLFMGNDSKADVQRIGQVELLLPTGKKLTLTDVFIVRKIGVKTREQLDHSSGVYETLS